MSIVTTDTTTAVREGSSPSAGLLVNHLVLNKDSNCVFRILYLPTVEGDPGYWISTTENTNIPKAFHPLDVAQGIVLGKYELVADPGDLKLNGSPSSASIEQRDRVYDLIRGVVAQEPDIYDIHKRSQLLSGIEAETGIKVNNLYRYLGKYWRGGKTPNALLPGFSNCGGHRTPQSTQKVRQGRPKRAGNNGKILVEADYAIFQKAIERFYTGTKKESFSQAYQDMLSTYYVRPTSDNDPSPVTLPADEKPSITQFRYWYRKNRDVVNDLKSKEGEHAFQLNHRAVVGRSETFVYGPGMAVQIDATIGDFYLVRKHHRDQIVGRPVVFLIRDVYSRMIIGMHVTLNNASWDSALAALHNAMGNKVDYCRRFGIEITPEQWPCQNIPSTIIADNGEMGDKSVEEVIARLGITVENCPPYRGDLKGIIEKTFDQLHVRMRTIFPGYVDKDAGTRGADDYRLNAVLDIDSFTAALIEIVLFFNNSHYMDDYELTPDLYRDGVNAVPLELWTYGMAHISGALKTIPDDVINKVLLPRENAVITPSGIRFKGLYYTCEEAKDQAWFEQARITGTKSLPIMYDRDCVDHIYIPLAGEDRLITCSLVDKSRAFRGLTHEDMDKYKEENDMRKAAHTQAEDQANATLTYKLEKILAGTETKEITRGKIKKALDSGSIARNRAEELKDHSGETAALERQRDQGIRMETNAADNAPAESTKSENAEDWIDSILGQVMKNAGLD